MAETVGNGWSIESVGQESESGITAGSEVGPKNTPQGADTGLGQRTRAHVMEDLASVDNLISSRIIWSRERTGNVTEATRT